MPGAGSSMVSKYRGVTRPCYRGSAGKWLAQSKNPRLWKYGFRSKIDAATWLSKRLGVKVSDLAQRSGPSPQIAMSCYQGVYPHARKDKPPKWEARVDGRLVSTHTTALAAARVVAKRLKTTVAKLKKEDPLTPKMARRLFMASYLVFHKYLPGDLANLFYHEGADKQILVQEPQAIILNRVRAGLGSADVTIHTTSNGVSHTPWASPMARGSAVLGGDGKGCLEL